MISQDDAFFYEQNKNSSIEDLADRVKSRNYTTMKVTETSEGFTSNTLDASSSYVDPVKSDYRVGTSEYNDLKNR